jgi:hypothetical protein
MDTDEVFLLKIFDSRRDGRARFNAHCAVFDAKVLFCKLLHFLSIENIYVEFTPGGNFNREF